MRGGVVRGGVVRGGGVCLTMLRRDKRRRPA